MDTNLEDESDVQQTPDNVLVEITPDENDNTEDSDSEMNEPTIGMEFDTIEEAKSFYNAYAYKIGFGIHISSSKRSNVTKEFYWVEFSCCSKPKESTDLKITNTTRKVNKLNKTGCKARMLTGLRHGKWRVNKVELKHNHQLVKSPTKIRFFRSHRKISKDEYALIQMLHEHNIPTKRIMSLVGDLFGNLRNAPFTKKDVSNLRTALRHKSNMTDMSDTIQYFQQLQVKYNCYIDFEISLITFFE